MSSNRLFRFPKPAWLNSAATRSAGVYLSGGLFAIALFVLIDAATWSKQRNASDFHVTFVDWVPALFSALGMLIINSINKARLSGDDYEGSSGGGAAWKARVVLFMGFAALAGGLAGGVTVMVLKYIVGGAQWPALWMGVANLVTNALVSFSSVVLWISQNMEDEYSYNLQL